MKRIFSLLSVALFVSLVSFPLFARPIIEKDLEDMQQQAQAAAKPKEAAVPAPDPVEERLRRMAEDFAKQYQAQNDLFERRVRDLEEQLALLTAKTKDLEGQITQLESDKVMIGEALEAFKIDGIKSRETQLGNALCDISAYYIRIRSNYQKHVDFAFHQGGLFKKGLAEGPFNEKAVRDILADDNAVHLVYGSLKGADVIAIFDKIASVPQGEDGFMQVSDDVKYTIDYSSGTGVIKNLLIGMGKEGKEEVDLKRDYTFVTNDLFFEEFLRELAINFTVCDPPLTEMLLDAVDYIGKEKWPLFPYLDGRITIAGEQ
ncbi:MAG: 5'-nucleotidase C-terminal domain-containing protein [Treponema sp.]|jgi:hypothetical protein|nr:5'-nucleotidase C-terminal domain-containing protein [Treponema sp.]